MVPTALLQIFVGHVENSYKQWVFPIYSMDQSMSISYVIGSLGNTLFHGIVVNSENGNAITVFRQEQYDFAQKNQPHCVPWNKYQL